MNTFQTIEKQEQALLELPKYKEYKIVCFGASTAARRALKVLRNIDVAPDFFCDNNRLKQGDDFEGYNVYNPEELFSKPFNFFVLITSMYYSEIKKQLASFASIKGSVFYLDVIATDISLSSLEHNTLSVSKNIQNTPFKIYVGYDKNSDSIQYEYEIKLAKSYGLQGFVQTPFAAEDKFQYQNYMSYANAMVLSKTKHETLRLIETKYNFNEVSYRRLLEYCLFDRYRQNELDKKLVINSWDLLSKGDFLENTSQVLSLFSREKIELIESTQKYKKLKDNALIWHLYHVDMFDEIQEELKNCVDLFDIYISVTLDCSIKDIQKIIVTYPEARIFLFENRGRDILPFLNIFKKIEPMGYMSICKIHTKKSIYQHSGKDWGKTLRTELFNAKEKIVDSFSKKNNIGAFVARNNISTMHKYLDANLENVEYVSKLLNIPHIKDFCFPVGTMFWCRAEVLQQLVNTNLEEKYFTLEGDSLDGHIEHAVERIIGLLIASNGYELKEV